MSVDASGRASASLSATDLASVVEEAWKAFLVSERRSPSPHPNYVYASAWRVCDRRMVYELTVPDQAQPFDAFALARFRRGNDRERDLLADLSRIGRNAEPEFRVVGQQDQFKVRDRRGRQVISGKVDAFLEVPRSSFRAPLEAKAWHPNIVDRLETFADVFENPWTRSGGYQLLSYLYGFGHPVGFLLLDRSGLPKLLPVVLEEHLERMEEFLTRAERVVDYALAGKLPPFLQGDAAECKRCPFYGTPCQPDLEAKDVRVLTDAELEQQLHRWHELKPLGREWLDLDKSIRAQLRGVQSAIAGPFVVTGKWTKLTTTELPAAVKKQYTKTDPQGQFRIEIEKMNLPAPARACAFCGGTVDGEYPIHRDGLGVGPVVDLCATCGDLDALVVWEGIAQPSTHPGAHRHVQSFGESRSQSEDGAP